MNKCYVYVYLNTLKPGVYNYNSEFLGKINFNFEPFYIGKGSNKRYLDHIKFPNSDKNLLKQGTINKIIKESGQYPIIQFVKTDLSHKEALILEIELIKLIGRRNLETGCLTNLTDGGDGCVGFKFDDVLKKRWSELAKKRAKFGKENHSSKPVYQYDLNGDFICKWDCKEDLKRKFNYNPTGIQKCCTYKSKTAHGFQWRNEFLGNKISPIIKGKSKKDGYLDYKDPRTGKKRIKNKNNE